MASCDSESWFEDSLFELVRTRNLGTFDSRTTTISTSPGAEAGLTLSTVYGNGVHEKCYNDTVKIAKLKIRLHEIVEDANLRTPILN